MDKDTKTAISETYGVINSESVSELLSRFQSVMSGFLTRQAAQGNFADLNSQAHLYNAFMELTAKMMGNPAKLAENQLALWHDYLNLWA